MSYIDLGIPFYPSAAVNIHHVDGTYQQRKDISTWKCWFTRKPLDQPPLGLGDSSDSPDWQRYWEMSFEKNQGIHPLQHSPCNLEISSRYSARNRDCQTEILYNSRSSNSLLHQLVLTDDLFCPFEIGFGGSKTTGWILEKGNCDASLNICWSLSAYLAPGRNASQRTVTEVEMYLLCF